MQTATATLLAATQSKEQNPVGTVEVDWARNGTWFYDPGVFNDTFDDMFGGAGNLADLTPLVESVSIDRSLSTDLPDAAKDTTGYGSAQATITLAGTFGGLPLSTVFSAYNNPLTTLAPRIGAPVRISMGYRTTAGAETLRQFTGRIRDVSIDPISGSVTLTALDGRERVRTPVQLPVTVGVSAGYFLDYIAAANGATTSFETSLNTSVTSPALDTSDPWEVLQQIASAEQGVILFDENGTLRFYNRDHMVGGSAVATITTSPAVSFANLMGIQAGESVDSVRNYVTVGAVPLVLDPVGTVIWSLGELIGIPANSSIVIPVEFPGVVHTITLFDYLAARNPDGTGGDITNLVPAANPVTATTWTLRVTNPNAFDAYLVRNSTAVPMGDPYAIFTGMCIRPAFEGGYTAVRQDSGSQQTYGFQTLDVGANVWRQSSVSADTLAAYLVSALMVPHPTLGAVEIVADLRLQLCDRVRVTEPDGLFLDGDFWVVGISTSFSAGGMTQSVTLRST